MATKSPTQKAKLTLRAIYLSLTKEVTNDYYVRPKLQKCLTMRDLATELAALSSRQEDPEEVERIGNALIRRMIWFLSSGYSVSTPMGVFRPTAKGTLLENELASAPDRDRITLGVNYSMSEEMRQALESAEIDVEIQKSTTGPQLISVTSAYNAEHPKQASDGLGVPITPGQTCIITGKNIKVGGEGETIGVTITRQDGDTAETFFFPPKQLFPNTPTRVGFVLPATVENESIWGVKLCTLIGNNASTVLKNPRVAVMDDVFVVGESIGSVTEPDDEEVDDGGSQGNV